MKTISKKSVVNLWLKKQRLLNPQSNGPITKAKLERLLNQVGGLQIDSVNVIDRAHYLTLWSRFGNYDRQKVDQWIYKDKIAYDYWGHEASFLPISFLPISKRRMKDFPPEQWKNSSWWKRMETSTASKRRVMSRIKRDGVTESSDIDRLLRGEKDAEKKAQLKEDKRSLSLLWHSGKLAITGREHFRKIFDLADNVYSDEGVASKKEYEESWLEVGLKGNGAVSESHLMNYFTSPILTVSQRRNLIGRYLDSGKIVSLHVEGLEEAFYASEEDAETLINDSELEEPQGTTLICPFDSFLWQRKRAEDLLDFHYRIEIYVPEKKRKFGYYVLPILHQGKLVGRLDPKFHRDRNELEIKSLHFEPWFRPTKKFRSTLAKVTDDLASFLNAEKILWPAESGM